MRNALAWYSLAGLLLLAGAFLLSACGVIIDVDRPIDETTLHVSHDVKSGDDAAETFGYELSIYEPEYGGDAWPLPNDNREDEWSRVTFRGWRTVASVDWVDPACGPTIEWSYVDSDAYDWIRRYYKDLPIQTKEDIDSLVALGFPSPPGAKGAYDENGAFYITEEDKQEQKRWNAEHTGWFFGVRYLSLPHDYLLTILPDDAQTAQKIDALQYLCDATLKTKKVQSIQVACGVKLPSDLPADADTARALVRYLETFNDDVLRSYLETHQPECLLP